VAGTYEYHVKAVFRSNNASAPTNSESLVLTGFTFNPPLNLTFSPIGNMVNLAWNVPASGSDGTLTGYNIYRDGVFHLDVTTNFATVTPLPGQNIYTVTAVYQTNTDMFESVHSNEVTVMGAYPDFVTAINCTFEHDDDCDDPTHGWTLVNGIQPVYWMIGEGAGPVAGGLANNSMFITNNGFNFSYQIGTNSNNHFYREVEFPEGATNIKLSFMIRVDGQGRQVGSSTILLFDYVYVSLPLSNFIPNPALFNEARLGDWNRFREPMNANPNPNEWYLIEIDVPDMIDGLAVAGTTRNLIFSWVNSNQAMGSGSHTPGAIDDILLTFEMVGDGGTLNVTLSSLTTNVIGERAVNINWITSSESNMKGFHLLRKDVYALQNTLTPTLSNGEGDIADVVRITQNLIPATNTALAKEYSFVDERVRPGEEYIYWLQAYLNDGSIKLFGPENVKVSDVEIPQLPLATTMSALYPNPIRLGYVANIDVSVKENETATLQIFNIRGQMVREYVGLQAGSHKLVWNQRDYANREVSSGVYFYRLTSESVSEVRRAVLLK
jgi:hypothetical protein